MPSAKAPTVYDVAKLAGVSIATVSFAFQKPERVRDLTREKVLAAAHKLGYVPSASARGLAYGRTGALGLYSYNYFLDTPELAGSPDIWGEDRDQGLRYFPVYVDEVQRGFELECWRQGMALMIGGGSHPSSEAVVSDIAGRVDGLAVFPRGLPPSVLRRIARRIPVVEVSEPSHGGSLSHVTVDNRGGMRVVTEHLIGVHGHRRLLFVEGSMPSSDGRARYEGFREALESAGLPVSDPVSVTAAVLAASADTADPEGRPESLVCVTDQDALAVMEGLSAAGVRAPHQVTVTGFDGILAGRLSRPTLTTVRQPMEQMGRAAVEILLERLARPSEPPVQRQFPVQLVVRESCGCRPA